MFPARSDWISKLIPLSVDYFEICIYTVYRAAVAEG